MSNHARRHMHARRARLATEARRRWADGETLWAPGTIPDRTPDSIQAAMDEAHEILPYVPGTQVCVTVYDPEDGLKLIADTFGEEAAVLVARQLIERGGSCPAVILSSRQEPDADGHACGHH